MKIHTLVTRLLVLLVLNFAGSCNAGSLTDCIGFSPEGSVQCAAPVYPPLTYNVCVVRGAYAYISNAASACGTELGTPSPMYSEGDATALANCIDSKLSSPPYANMAVTWDAPGAIWRDNNLCWGGLSTTEDHDGRSIYVLGTSMGHFAEYRYTKSSTPTCASPYIASTQTIDGVQKLLCKPPACPAGATFYPATGQCLTTVDVWSKFLECHSCAGRLYIGNPIYPMTGGKKEVVSTGLSVGGIGLDLVYDSLGRPNPSLWNSNLHKRLIPHFSGTGPVVANRGEGKSVGFVSSSGTGADVCGASAGVSDAVSKVGSDYQYKDLSAKRLETYDSNGYLKAIFATSGQVLITTFDSAGNLKHVADSGGKGLSFEYVLPPGRSIATGWLISRISDTMGRVIILGYDANWNMTTLTWPDSKVRTFLYEDAINPWALTGVIDENGDRYATWTYASSGQALTVEHALGTDRHSVDYAAGLPSNSATVREEIRGTYLCRYHEVVPPSQIDLIKSNGSTATASIDYSSGHAVLSGMTQSAGSGHPASNRFSAVDTGGNITSRDHFDGTRTCYAYDTSSRETTRIEGLSNAVACASVISADSTLPAGASKTTTQWHADWKLPKVVTSPGLIQTTVYHGQPDPFNGNATASCTTAINLPNGKPLPVACKTVLQSSLDITANDPGAPALDAQYANQLLMLHGDGANGSKTMTDSSPAPKTATAYGGAVVSTAQSKFGGSSLYFDGLSSSYIDFPYTAIVTSGDETIEGWVYPLTTATGTTWDNLGNTLLYTSSNGMTWYHSGNTSPIWAANSAPINSWTHFAAVRSGTTCTLYSNGTAVGSASCPSPLGSASITLRLGNAHWTTANPYKGYLDDFRISNVARYGGNFTVPTKAFGASSIDTRYPAAVTTFTYDASGRMLTSKDSLNRETNYAYYAETSFDSSLNASGPSEPYFDQVSLLLHGDGVDGSTGFIDSSATPKVATVSGNSTLSIAKSKFGGTSLFFDGAISTYIDFPSSSTIVNTGDLTIEGWVYPTASTVGAVYSNLSANASSHNLLYVSGTSLQWYFDANSNVAASNLALLNQWTHFALVRSGTTCTIYTGGVAMSSASCPNNVGTTATTLRLAGAQWSTAYPYSGYIDDFRITRGKARYLSNFVPPTAPYADQGLRPDPNAVGHTIGDLQSIADPKGFVTTFNAYDMSGRVLQMTDPKGVVTDLTYTPRGWVSSVTVTPPGGTARVTTYTYDAVGQVIGVANPDGTTVSYTYDAAHRLIGATDAKGNSVNYTLDNVGNRIAEQLKDPSGVLQRTMSRSFDALNRVQQLQLQ